MRFHATITKEELENLYISQNKSVKELCSYYSVSISTINRALRYYKLNKSRKQVAKVNMKVFKEKYGVENPSQLEEVKRKKEEINLSNYGVKYFFETNMFKEKANDTKIKKYGNQNYNNREKAEKTLMDLYNVKNVSQLEDIKTRKKQTYEEKYGVENISQLEEVKEKKKQTCFNHYGVYNPIDIKGVKEIIYKKGIETKKRNGTTNGKEYIMINNHKVKCSFFEKIVFEKLVSKYKNVEYQYMSDNYPFVCDFYIKDIDLYIEIQGTWVHGFYQNKLLGPYDEKNVNHQSVLKEWQKKAKTSNFYKHAIKIWTIRDPLKRKMAKNNGLNWLEFFTMKDFLDWYNDL